MASSLPQELNDEIVSNLIDDTESLKACSLALPGYLPFCQSRLFSKIILNCKRGTQKPRKLKCLLADSPHLAKYVKCIKILELLSETLSKDTVDSLLYILPLLRSLTSFYLHYHHDGLWRQLPQILVDCFVDAMRLPSLTHVDISGVVPLQFLNHGLHLQHISTGLACVVVLPPPTFSQHPAKELIHLETLHTYPLVGPTNWFLSPETDISLNRLKKLTLIEERAGDSYHVSRILDACRQTLEEFNYEPHYRTYYTQSPCPDFLDLACLAALRALRIRVEVSLNLMHSCFCSPLPWYTQHIERLPPSNVIEHITIHLVVSASLDLPSFDWSSWKTISTVLLKRLSRLRSVELGIYCCDETHYDPCISNILYYTADLQNAGIFKLEKLSVLYGDICLYPPYSTWKCETRQGATHPLSLSLEN